MSAREIMKALDAEQRDRRKAVWAKYELKMKGARKTLNAAKAKMAEAERVFETAQKKAGAQHTADLEEVQRWAMEAKRVARGRAPVQMSDIRRMEREFVTTDGPMRITLPHVSCLDGRS